MINNHQINELVKRRNPQTPIIQSWQPWQSWQSRHSRQSWLYLTALASMILLLCALWLMPRTRAAATLQNSVVVTSVSAASFAGAPASLAPDSIAAAFGTQLAGGTQAATSQPLPTSLIGTTVTVNGVAAPLFFVSPTQVNYLIPSNITAGTAQVVITATLGNGDQVVSRGEVTIAQIAPSLFTANANGLGAPAANTGRINAMGQFVFDMNPPFETDPLHPGQVIPRPVDPGSNDQPAFLILYGTGIRTVSVTSVRAVIGGIEVPVDAVTPLSNFTGLDQINVKIPNSLRGSGIVDVALAVNGVSSNAVKVNLAGPEIGPMVITGFSTTDPVLAGQTVAIQGTGFVTTSDQNTVRFGSVKARVTSATTNELSVVVPFGAESDRVTVQTPQNEVRSNNVFPIRTSISGIIQSTGSSSSPPTPLGGVTVRLVGSEICVRTTPQGTFVMGDTPPGLTQIEIDGGTTIADPPFPQVTIKTTIRPDRDNRLPQAINLQQIIGGSGIVGDDPALSNGSPLAARSVKLQTSFKPKSATGHNLVSGPSSPAQPVVISDRGVSLEVPFGTSVRFPDGRTSGQVQVTIVEKSRLPGITLPKGVFSPTIAQITPLGTQFSPGASLRFPNPVPTSLAAGAKVDLYRYDFQSGAFIKRGSGTVSPDGSQVVSDGRIVDLASFWLVAAPGGVTTVIGRIVDEQGRPVPGALASVNGRSDTSDLNGGFSILDVSTVGSSPIQVEVVLPLQYGTPPRATSALTAPVSGGVTNVGTIQLNGINQPAIILSPFAIDLASNSPPVRVEVTFTQPAPNDGLLINLTSGDPSVVSVPGNVTIPAGQTKASFNLTRSRPGVTSIVARATVAGNAVEAIAMVTVSTAAPELRTVSPQSAPPGAEIVIGGLRLSANPKNNAIAFVRNNSLAAVLDPSKNEVMIDELGNVSVKVKVPAIGEGAAGIVATVVNDQTGVLSDTSAPLSFTVLASDAVAPQLANVTPVVGKPRDTVTINGTGFSQQAGENLVFFRQGFGDVQARIINATPSALSIEVPSQTIITGPAMIIARRISPNGGISDPSNALDFTITAVPTSPPAPTLTQIVNAANGSSSGRDGDPLTAIGTGFGTNFLNLQTSDLGNDDPLISLLLFRQENQLVNAAIPIGASGGTQLTATVPTGLSVGVVQVTVITYDLETGLVSSESAPISFTVTAGSLLRLDETEPNNTPETAARIFLQTLTTGSASVVDQSGFEATFSNGTVEPAPDLFVLSLAAATNVTFRLDFTSSGDLDLLLASATPDAEGLYPFIDEAINRTGTTEEFTRQLPAGDYLIAIGTFSGGSSYSLTVAQANSLASVSMAASNQRDMNGILRKTGGIRLKGHSTTPK